MFNWNQKHVDYREPRPGVDKWIDVKFLLPQDDEMVWVLNLEMANWNAKEPKLFIREGKFLRCSGWQLNSDVRNVKYWTYRDFTGVSCKYER